jgi:PIN domain nuclease of toxin-antitoxin system
MRVLVDTNVLLWWMVGSDRVRDEWERLLRADSTEVLISAVSVAEIAIKSAIGILPETPERLSTTMADHGLSELVFSVRHAEALGGLPPHHKDPFDRMIIAQALTEGLPVMTADQVFRDYGVQVI